MNAHRCGWGEPYPCCGDGDRVRGTANPAEESDDFADQWIRPYVTARAESGEAGAADTLRLSKVQFAEPSGDAVFIVMHGSTSTVTVSMSRPQPVRHAAPRYRPRLVTAVATVVGTLVVAAAAWHSSDETSSRGPDPSTALEVVEPGDEATEKTADSTTTPRLPPLRPPAGFLPLPLPSGPRRRDRPAPQKPASLPTRRARPALPEIPRPRRHLRVERRCHQLPQSPRPYSPFSAAATEVSQSTISSPGSPSSVSTTAPYTGSTTARSPVR